MSLSLTEDELSRVRDAVDRELGAGTSADIELFSIEELSRVTVELPDGKREVMWTGSLVTTGRLADDAPLAEEPIPEDLPLMARLGRLPLALRERAAEAASDAGEAARILLASEPVLHASVQKGRVHVFVGLTSGRVLGRAVDRSRSALLVGAVAGAAIGLIIGRRIFPDLGWILGMVVFAAVGALLVKAFGRPRSRGSAP